MDTQLYPIILNSSNAVAGTNNSIYRYNFPQGSVKFNKSKVAVASISMYYSWYNILASLGNNTFTYTWYGFGTSVIETITIPDGFYDIAALNAYLQSQMIANGHYLIDASGDYVYYLEFATNSTYYSIQLNSYPIPTALPTGYSNPAVITFPAVATTPQITIISNAFRDIIGFNAGTYPAAVQTTTYSKLSDFTPQVSPTQSVILSCTLLNNKYSNPGTVLYSFSPAGVSFGSLIEAKPSQFSFVDIQSGNYNTFDITFLDQSFNFLKINDNNLVVQLLIESKIEN
jgi:hypothetical protein